LNNDSWAAGAPPERISTVAVSFSQTLERAPQGPLILQSPEKVLTPGGASLCQPTPHEAFLNQKIFANLDMLRGAAILAVVFHHAGTLETGWLAVLHANCRHGVSLFFALSGFLICSLLLREERRNGHVRLKDFYIRRSLRLFPLYYGMLAVYGVLIFGLGMFSPENQTLFKERLPYNVLYLSNFLPVTGPFFFAWSLAIEEQFYLIFGQLFRWARRSWLVGLIALLVVIKPLMNLAGGLDNAHLGMRILFSYSEPLLWGVLGGFALHRREWFNAAQILSHPRVLGGLAAALLLMLFTVPLHDKSGLASQAIYVLMAFIVMGCAIRPAIPVPGYRVLAHIGVVCYGIYLMHMLVIMVVQRIVTDNLYLTFLLSVVIVTAVASLVYRYFESPILRYKKHFSHA
jgi:peptidoglycan/LPS O-acetylase OafA/YrhL